MKLNSQFHFSGWSLGYRQIELELVWESGAHIRAHGSRTIMSCTVFQVDCYDSVQGSAHDYGALSLSGEYIPFRNYAGKYILFVNVATY